MKILFIFFWFFIGCAGLLLPRLAAGQLPVYDTIMNRVCKILLKDTAGNNQLAAASIGSLLPDGSWPDVDYNDKSMTTWLPGKHLTKLRALITTYITSNGDKKQYAAIVKALNYWYQKNPQSNNWWHNEIASPQMLGELLILMHYGKQPLPKLLTDSLLQRMKRGDPHKQAGANKTDVALHYFYRGLLTKDQSLLKDAVDQIFNPVRLVHLEEGLQSDYAYLQHGTQLQISSYGLVFLTGVLTVAAYVHETPFALNPSKVKLLSDFYSNTYLKTIRGSYIDFNVEGRGVSRKNILNKQQEKNRLALMQLVDPQRMQEWESAIIRTSGAGSPDYKITPFHRYFWCGDYTLHLRPGYSFHVRTVSTRTRRSEMGNEENLLGKYLSDGATAIQRRGPEYYNIMPVWEWDKIPGVTNRDSNKEEPIEKLWGESGNTAFAGGVSDGIYGATAYILNYDSVSAKKAWFFFDDEIICLGAGINSEATEGVITTINQCWVNGNILTSGKNNRKKKNGWMNIDEKWKCWVLHDSIGYFFPKGGNIHITGGQQTGSWYRINHSFPDSTVTGQVFKLWLNHGTKPGNANYAYIILPGMGNAEKMNAYKPVINLLANSDTVQAVYHTTLKMWQVVFYKPGIVRSSALSVKADKPCILMLKDIDANNKYVTVADPLQQEKVINIIITDLQKNKSTHRKIDLPENEMAGASVSLNINLE